MNIYLFNGQCPECKLNEVDMQMRLNFQEIWECPACQLQVLIESDNAPILRYRGKGDFQIKPSILKKHYRLEETRKDSYRNGKKITTADELKDFLAKVEPQNEFSMLKLIDAYTQYKFNDKSKEPYKKQTKHFNIDFEDFEILDVLQIRDKTNSINPLFAHSYLFDFQNQLLWKYYNNDNSWLPEMGMSKIQYYLSLKHFPHFKSALINSDAFLAKQSLKGLLLDVIGIIHNNTKVLLSYDPKEVIKLNNEMISNN